MFERRRSSAKSLAGSPCRVTYIHQHFVTPSQAGGTRSFEFARRLAAEGHDVTMICGGTERHDFEVSGFRVRQIPVSYRNSMGYAQRVASFLRFMIRSTVLSATTPADVILATSTPLTVAVPGLIAARLRRARFVFEVRDLWPSVPARLGVLTSRPLLSLAQRLERITYARADRVIALSPGMRDGVLQTAPFADVRVVPNASDVELFAMDEQARRDARADLGWTHRPTAVYAGSFGESYRIQWMVELAASCPGVNFQIIGSGQATQAARQLSDALNLPTDDLLPGSLPKSEVARRVGAADIVISSLLDDPALRVNSLNKVFDALAAARPVVFNHDGWLPDLLIRRGAGWRLPNDPKAAGEQLARILADADALSRASQCAARLAREDFNRDSLYARFREALFDKPRKNPPLGEGR